MDKAFQQISDLVHNGDRAGARRLALDLLAGHPNDPQVLYVVSQFTDDIAQALIYLRRAAALEPGNEKIGARLYRLIALQKDRDFQLINDLVHEGDREGARRLTLVKLL